MRGRAARLARQAHNLEVVGSNPTPASIFSRYALLRRGFAPPAREKRASPHDKIPLFKLGVAKI